MKNQTVFEALCGPKPSFVPVFTEQDRANSLEAIIKGKLRIKTYRILDYAKEYWGFDPTYSTYHGLKYLAQDIFDTYNGLSCTPVGLFRFRTIGREWIRHLVIAFSLEYKWVQYFDKQSSKGYKGLPKEKQIFPVESTIEFDI